MRPISPRQGSPASGLSPPEHDSRNRHYDMPGSMICRAPIVCDFHSARSKPPEGEILRLILLPHFFDMGEDKEVQVLSDSSP
jgi:hypothetical protein